MIMEEAINIIPGINSEPKKQRVSHLILLLKINKQHRKETTGSIS